MEERHRQDGFEVTFVVEVARSEAWSRLADATPASDELSPPRPGQWWIPAVEGAADEVEVVPGERLRARKATFPCAGTEIVVTMEDEGSGTRITFVQHGFGAGFEDQRPWLEAGWCVIRADLHVFFERGLQLGRHLRPWASLGCGVVEADGGLVVEAVSADGYAARAGLRRGDLVVTLAGSPVVTVRDLAVLVRAHRPGSECTVHALRGTTEHRATARL